MITIKLHNYSKEDTDNLLWSIQHLLMEEDKQHIYLTAEVHSDLSALVDFLTLETQTGYTHGRHPCSASKNGFVDKDLSTTK